jgi:hypothetical protein
LLILRALLWLVEGEQRRRDSKGGPYDPESDGKLLADEIRAELEEADVDAAALRAAREEETPPVHKGREIPEEGEPEWRRRPREELASRD